MKCSASVGWTSWCSLLPWLHVARARFGGVAGLAFGLVAGCGVAAAVRAIFYGLAGHGWIAGFRGRRGVVGSRRFRVGFVHEAAPVEISVWCNAHAGHARCGSTSPGNTSINSAMRLTT